MKITLITFLTILLLLPVSAFGKIQTITHTVKQPFGGSQSPDDARISAIAKAKREVLELAGTYVESTTVVKNAQIEKDEVLALSAGVLKVEIVSQRNYITDDSFGIEVTVRVEVDTAVLETHLKKVLEDRNHFEQLKQARAREKELLERIAVLEEENKKIGTSDLRKKNLKKEFQETSQGLVAVEWLDKATQLWRDGKLTDHGKVIQYLNEAIRLKPDYLEAYNNRGVAYSNVKQFQRAIEDYNEAIRLKPDYAFALHGRGLAYANLKQYREAIEDFDKAIRLEPNYEGTYYDRGLAYDRLGQFQQAIEDYNEAIRLKPDYWEAYNNRGLAYDRLRQSQRAIEDYNEAIRLKPDYAEAYTARGNAYGDLKQYQKAIENYNDAIRLKPDYEVAYYNRGVVYGILGQYQSSIDDYKEAIRLKPDNALYYNNLGVAYILSGNNREGCRSLISSCEMNACRGYEWAKQRGVCQ